MLSGTPAAVKRNTPQNRLPSAVFSCILGRPGGGIGGTAVDDFEPQRGKQVVRDLDQLRAFLDAATVGYLGVCREGEPYVVPVNFARDGETIFIHSATTGKKVAFLEANPQVCFCVVPRAVQVEGKGAWLFSRKCTGPGPGTP